MRVRQLGSDQTFGPNSSLWNHGCHILVDTTNLMCNSTWHEFVSCPVKPAAIATPRAFATACGTLHHCVNLSIAAFAVRSNILAAWCCSHRPCWLVLFPLSCWTSLRGSARRRGDHCNHCAHIAVGPLAAAILKVFDTSASHSRRIIGCVDS